MSFIKFLEILAALAFPFYVTVFTILGLMVGKVEKESFLIVGVVELVIALLAISFFAFVHLVP